MITIFIIPVVFGITTLFLRGDGYRFIRRKLLILCALLHNAGSLSLLFLHAEADKLGLIFLLLISAIFTLTSFYSLGYFPIKRKADESESGGHIYVSCMLFFLAAMSLAKNSYLIL